MSATDPIEKQCEKHAPSLVLAIGLTFVGLLIVVIALAGWIGLGLFLALCGLALFRSVVKRAAREVAQEGGAK